MTPEPGTESTTNEVKASLVTRAQEVHRKVTEFSEVEVSGVVEWATLPPPQKKGQEKETEGVGEWRIQMLARPQKCIRIAQAACPPWGKACSWCIALVGPSELQWLWDPPGAKEPGQG